MLNKKGFLGFLASSLIVKILIVTILAILVIPILMLVSPIIRWVMIVIIVFFIYDIVSKAFGNNILTFLFTGVLLYFLVYKYLYLTTMAVIFYFILSIGLMSVFVWGTKSVFGNKQLFGKKRK